MRATGGRAWLLVLAGNLYAVSAAQASPTAAFVGTWPNSAFLRDGGQVSVQTDYEALEYDPTVGPAGEFRQWIRQEDLNPGVFYNPGGPEQTVSSLDGQPLPERLDVGTETWCLGAIFFLPPNFAESRCVGSFIDVNDNFSTLFSPYSPSPDIPRNNFWAPENQVRAFYSRGLSNVSRHLTWWNAENDDYEDANLWYLFTTTTASLGRNSIADPISRPPNPSAPANYYDIQSVEQRALLSLPFKLVRVGEPPDGQAPPAAVPIQFSLNWELAVYWAHPPTSLSSLSCELNEDAEDCSWAQSEVVLVASDRRATLDDDLLSSEWTGDAYDVWSRELTLNDLDFRQSIGDIKYHPVPGGSPGYLQRSEDVRRSPSDDLFERGEPAEARLISVPVVANEDSQSFYLNFSARGLSRMGADSAGILSTEARASLFTEPFIDAALADRYGLVEPLSHFRATPSQETVPGPESSRPQLLGAGGAGVLTCSNTGLTTGPNTRITTYFLHRPQQPPQPINRPSAIPFLCSNDFLSTATVLQTNTAFLIFSQGPGPAKLPPAQATQQSASASQQPANNAGDGPWYRINPDTGTVTSLDLGPVMVGEPRALAEDALFIGGPKSGGGLFDLALWLTDGTLAGTREFAQARYSDTPAAGYEILQVIGDQVYFQALPEFGTAAPLGFVWRSDGTSVGTVNIELPAAGGIIWASAPLRDGILVDSQAAGVRDVYFVANDSQTAVPVSAWLGADAPTNGLRLLHDHALGGLALMYDDDDNGVYLSDGTPAGTAKLFDMPHFLGNDSLNRSALHNGYVYFGINDSRSDTSTLWRTDGTVSGTQSVTTPWAGTGSLDGLFGEFKRFNGFLAYVRQDIRSSSSYQSSLWLMAEEDNQFPVFFNQPAVAPPQTVDGSVQQLTEAADGRLYFVGRRSVENAGEAGGVIDGNPDPATRPQLPNQSDVELYYLDTNAVALRDPNVAALAAAGPVRPLASAPGRTIFRNSFEEQN